MPENMISVLIPVYNGSVYLADAIESALLQSDCEREVVVIDDGSTDSTAEVAQGYGDTIRYIKKNNGGVASALNVGLENSRGEFIAWLSHDDRFCLGKLSRQLSYLDSHSSCAAVYTDFARIDMEGRRLDVRYARACDNEDVFFTLFESMFINGSTVLMRKSCVESVGAFNEGLSYTQDVDLWLRLSHRYELGYIPEVLGEYRSHSEQDSRRAAGLHQAEKRATYRTHFEERIGLLLESVGRGDPGSLIELACAYERFASIAAWRHRWYDIADEYYAKSRQVWPTKKNPAYWRSLVGTACYPGYIHRVRSLISQIGRRVFC